MGACRRGEHGRATEEGREGGVAEGEFGAEDGGAGDGLVERRGGRVFERLT